MVAWAPQSSEEVLRRRIAGRFVEPLRERRFTYGRYERLLAALAEPGRFHVVPLRDFRAAPLDRPVVALRHDVDHRLDSALELARLEHSYSLRATYFVLHTARYYGVTRRGYAAHHEELLPVLRRLQDEYGHEVGWHNDLVTLQCVYGIEPRDYLAQELQWLREGGIDVRGIAAHGGRHGHLLGFHNRYFVAGLDELVPGFPHREVVPVDGGTCRIAKGRLAEFDLEYEAYHLDNGLYFSDSFFDRSRRWHPELLELDRLRAGDKAIILLHPCHWDASLARKYGRTLAAGVRRAGELALRRR